MFLPLLYHRSSFSYRQIERAAMSSKSTSVPLPPDVSRGSDLLIVAWLNVSVAVLFVSLRFYIRGILRKNLGWDDYIILIANVSFLLSRV